MKKIVSMLLAVVLCIGMLTSALADTGVTLSRTYDYSPSFVDGTPYLKLTGRNGNAFALHDETLLTEPRYSSPFLLQGLLKASDMLAGDSLNSTGLFDLEGNIAVPFEYGDVDVLNKHWVAGVKLTAGTADNFDYSANNKTEFYLISEVDLYFIPTGKVATLSRSEYLDAYADYDWLSVNVQNRTTGVVSAYDGTFTMLGTDLRNTYDDKYAVKPYTIYRDNGQDGIKDQDGNIVLAACYKDISSIIYGDYAIADTGSGKGVIRLDGTLVVPTNYDEIKSTSYLPWNPENGNHHYDIFGYFCVIKDNKIGYVDINGNETCPPKYNKSNAQISGASYLLTDLNGDFLIVAADGTESTTAGFDRCNALGNCGGFYYTVRTTDYLYGLIDWHGNMLLPAEYTNIRVSGDGRYVLCTRDYSSADLYELSYPDPILRTEDMPAQQDPASAENVSDTPVAESSDESASADGTVLSGMPVTGIPGLNEPAASEHPAITLLESAIVLLNTDPAANASSASALLSIAMSQIGDSNPAANTLLESALTLLVTDASGNAAAIVALLTSVISLL